MNTDTGIPLQLAECGAKVCLEEKAACVQLAALPVIPIPICFKTGQK